MSEISLLQRLLQHLDEVKLGKLQKLDQGTFKTVYPAKEAGEVFKTIDFPEAHVDELAGIERAKKLNLDPNTRHIEHEGQHYQFQDRVTPVYEQERLEAEPAAMGKVTRDARLSALKDIIEGNDLRMYDLNPENVGFDKTGDIKILDAGILEPRDRKLEDIKSVLDRFKKKD